MPCSTESATLFRSMRLIIHGPAAAVLFGASFKINVAHHPIRDWGRRVDPRPVPTISRRSATLRTKQNSTKRMPMFLLLVLSLLALFLAIGLYLYYSPGKTDLLAKPGGTGTSQLGPVLRAG